MQSDHNGSRRLNKLYMRAAPLGFVDHKKMAVFLVFFFRACVLLFLLCLRGSSFG